MEKKVKSYIRELVILTIHSFLVVKARSYSFFDKDNIPIHFNRINDYMFSDFLNLICNNQTVYELLVPMMKKDLKDSGMICIQNYFKEELDLKEIQSYILYLCDNPNEMFLLIDLNDCSIDEIICYGPMLKGQAVV